MPYGEFDIYNKDQLYEQLAQAIVDNLHVQRWIFKLDDEFNGRGIAYCDIAKNLNCYKSALKDMIKYGDKWSKRWAHVRDNNNKIFLFLCLSFLLQNNKQTFKCILRKQYLEKS